MTQVVILIKLFGKINEKLFLKYLYIFNLHQIKLKLLSEQRKV